MKGYKKYFFRTIRTRYPEAANHIISELDNHFAIISIDTKFAKTSTNPIDKRLDFTSYFLALIKTLEKRGESFEDIRMACLEIVTEYVRPKNRMQQFLRQVPANFTNTWLANAVIAKFNKKINIRSHPDGFVATIITDKKDTFGLGYGIDILECGICKLFKKHNYEKYSSILCEVDHITSGLAGLELIRTGTIAQGEKKCDFRFKKKS
jgi:hypothetical protein